jgi:glutaredoxin 3
MTVSTIVIYSTNWCGSCDRAKALLTKHGLAYDEIEVGSEPGFRSRLAELTGGHTVPQIVIDGEPIGGYLELSKLDRNGLLDELTA